MYGQPLECLKVACLQLGERFYNSEQKPFEKLITVTFDHRVEDCFSPDLQWQYNEKINALEDIGGTDFLPVFQYIKKLILEHRNVTEVHVVFVTDGQDGRHAQDPQFQNIIQEIKQIRGVETSFLTIGFSQDHDAQKMNLIAQSGSKEGNFIYVDT